MIIGRNAKLGPYMMLRQRHRQTERQTDRRLTVALLCSAEHCVVKAWWQIQAGNNPV